jgi:hypothetical protein
MGSLVVIVFAVVFAAIGGTVCGAFDYVAMLFRNRVYKKKGRA